MRSPRSSSAPALYVPGRSSSSMEYRCPSRNDSLPMPSKPSVDERLAVPEARQEVFHGERIQCMPAKPSHAFAQLDLGALLKVHVAEGYRAAADMLTRVSEDSDVAPDAAICKVNGESIFAQRELERLAFEIADSTTPLRLKERVTLLSERGVHRIFCIDIQDWQVLEWNATSKDWKKLLMDTVIEDECLIRPLSVEALLDSAKQVEEIGHAMLKRNNPVIEEALQVQKKQGKQEGKVEGERVLLIKLLNAKFHTVPASARERIEQASAGEVERWAERILSASTLDEVFAKSSLSS